VYTSETARERGGRTGGTVDRYSGEGAWGVVRRALRLATVGMGAVWAVLAVRSLIDTKVVNGTIQLGLALVLVTWSATARAVAPPGDNYEPDERERNTTVLTARPDRAARRLVMSGSACLLAGINALTGNDGAPATAGQRVANVLLLAFLLLAVRVFRVDTLRRVVVDPATVTMRTPRLVRRGISERQRSLTSIDSARPSFGTVALLPQVISSDGSGSPRPRRRTRLPVIPTGSIGRSTVVDALRARGVPVR
jgi:hypothetical protein